MHCTQFVGTWVSIRQCTKWDWPEHLLNFTIHIYSLWISVSVYVPCTVFSLPWLVVEILGFICNGWIWGSLGNVRFQISHIEYCSFPLLSSLRQGGKDDKVKVGQISSRYVQGYEFGYNLHWKRWNWVLLKQLEQCWKTCARSCETDDHQSSWSSWKSRLKVLDNLFTI
jgi:hypothetical protein